MRQVIDIELIRASMDEAVRSIAATGSVSGDEAVASWHGLLFCASPDGAVVLRRFKAEAGRVVELSVGPWVNRAMRMAAAV